MKLKKIAASMAAMAFAAGVVAKENDVGIFGTSGKGMGDHTFIAQDGPKADNIRKILDNVKMPAGFKIELYALVPDARDMAMAPQGTVLFVGTRKDKVWVVSDRDRNGVGDDVHRGKHWHCFSDGHVNCVSLCRHDHDVVRGHCCRLFKFLRERLLNRHRRGVGI